MLRFLRLIFEFIAAFVGVGILLGVLLVWRLNAKPISSGFLTPYIAEGIESLIPDSKVDIGSTLLTWGGADRVISVHAENIKVSDAAGREIASLPAFDAKLSVLGLMFGQFMPKDLSIDHLQIKLEHDAKGRFAFGKMAVGGGEPSQSAETVPAFVQRITRHLSYAALMHKLAVTHAVFDVHDDITQKDWSVSVPEISITRTLLSAANNKIQYGALDGRITVEVTQKDTVSSLDMQYAYDPAKETHSLSTVFTDVTPAFMAGGHPETLGLGIATIFDLPLTGKIRVLFDKNLAVMTAAAEVQGGEGHLVYPDFWDNPAPVKSLELNAGYDRDRKRLTVFDTHIDFQGPTLSLDVDGVPPAENGKDIDFTLFLNADNLPMNRYGELWPKPVLPDPRYWLVDDLRDGIFTHAEVNLKGSLAWNDLANLSITEGGGKLSAEKARVTFLEGMPPAENVSAEASFDLKKMDVKILGGGIGNIRMSPFTVHITGLADPDQDIDIPLQVSGPVPDILRLLDHPPLGYAKALGLSPDDIDGKIEGAVDFRFPLLKTLQTKDLFVHATGNATSIASTKLVPGIAIDQGDLALTLDTTGFGLVGQANLNKLPFHIVWHENFETKPGQPLRHATVTGFIKDDQWNNFGISSFNGTKGPIAVTLDITNSTKKKAIYSGALDMTQAAVEFDIINWKKPANVPATLKFTADTQDGEEVNVSALSLRGPQIIADGDATLSPDMSQILSLNLSPLAVGRTNASLQFDQSFGPDGSLSFDAKGASLDIAGFRSNASQTADTRPQEYTIKVDKLYTGSDGEIDEAQISASRDQQGWSEISLHGLADHDTPLSIDLTSQPDGHRTFSIASGNFGKVMKGLGFTDTIKGGKLSIIGASTVEEPRVITGKIKISDFTVEKLPVLALLLNATSPFGFIDILTDSTDFSRFQGDFRWQDDNLTLTQAHASGNSVGINIDGKINLNTDDANLQGTLVPFSVVNNILNYIPLIGDLLTGGENQGVLAVAYQIKGSLSSPKISVNPVSLLTPGFLRNLFFPDDTTD